MTERPILFSAPMVRALLAGTKTQTRRVMMIQPDRAPDTGRVYRDKAMTEAVFAAFLHEPAADGSTVCICPYGPPGDQLWVREAWSTHSCFDSIPPRELTTRSIHYRADGEIETGKYRPPMFMPRWASRIQLEVTDVRVERLQEISEADAQAEGARCADPVTGHEVLFPSAAKTGSYCLHYRDIWEQINGPGSWAANPWVWAVSFKVINP